MADVLLRLLESGQLEGLREKRGRTSRGVAVEALLRLGFPMRWRSAPRTWSTCVRRARGARASASVRRLGRRVSLGMGLLGEWLTFPSDFTTGSTGLPVVAMMGMQLLGPDGGGVGC